MRVRRRTLTMTQQKCDQSSYTYNEFGEATKTDAQDFLNENEFAGAVSDKSTGLVYMNARFYSPTTGRFVSQDTYSGSFFEPWTQHLYAYCNNNPASMVDPTGHMAELSKYYMHWNTGEFGETSRADYTALIKAASVLKKRLHETYNKDQDVKQDNNCTVAITGETLKGSGHGDGLNPYGKLFGDMWEEFFGKQFDPNGSKAVTGAEVAKMFNLVYSEAYDRGWLDKKYTISF